jgi:excisionase family DNA binding protein
MWLLADGLPQDQMHNTAWNMKARWDLLDFLPEAAEALGIGLNSAYEAIARGEIPHIRIGQSIRVPRTALEQLFVGAGQADHHAID